MGDCINMSLLRWYALCLHHDQVLTADPREESMAEGQDKCVLSHSNSDKSALSSAHQYQP